MRSSFLLSLFREDIVRALFWTLVHSLWQGLALAILAGLVILFTRRSAPVWRYTIFLGLLCLFVAGAGTTFFLLLRTPQAATAAVPGDGAIFNHADPADTPVASALYVSSGQSWGERLTVFFNQRATIIVTIWFVVLGLRLLKLLFDLWAVQRLRYYRTSVPGGYWKQRVMELAQRIGIKQAVRILESSVVKTPMMAGVLKPVILVPLGMLAQLPPQEMEAILLHELAHIRRKDYVTNLLQCSAEILFFFNPAVLWISSLIREERENCCDDIAVGEVSDKRDLVSALVSFQEYSHLHGALTFAGTKNHLLRRVKRIVHRDNKTLDIREKFFLLACLFITAGLTMGYAYQTPARVKTSKVAPAASKVEWEKPGKPVKMQELPKTIEAVADTSKKPASVRDTAVTKEEGRKWESMLQQQREALELEQTRLNEARATLAEQERELEMAQARLNRMSRMQDQAMARSQRQLEQNRSNAERMARLQMERTLESRRQLDTDRFRLLRSAEVTRRGVEKSGEIIEPVLSMLLEKGLITQKEDVSFSLTDEELIVNDKKQPDEVFQDFKKAFLHSSRDYIKYSGHGGSESSSISQHNN